MVMENCAGFPNSKKKSFSSLVPLTKRLYPKYAVKSMRINKIRKEWKMKILDNS